MKVLSLNRQFLVILGVCPAPNSKWQFFFKLNFFVVLVLQILGLISSIWFIAVYLTKDLNSVLYAGFHTSAYSSSTYSLIVGFVVQHKITTAFEKLQTICDENKLRDSTGILERTNERGGWITANFMKFLTLGYFLASIVLAALSALYCYVMNGFIIVEQLYVPFKFILPWDQQTLRGWINETIFSVISSSLYLHTNVVFLTFFIAICEFHQAFSTYFIALLKLVQRCNGSKKAKPLLCYIIRYHVSIKSFFWETSDVYSLILLTQLLCIVLHMTCSVFQMDMAIKNPDLNFYMILMSLLVSGANMYFYCYYGNRSTSDYERIANCLFESNWNEQPVELQKFFKMMIANAQRPMFYHGFRIVRLSLETYLKLLKTVISYYLMFKTLTE